MTSRSARAVYALALYFGHRRSDIGRVRWDDLCNVVQQKGGKALWLPMHPELARTLEGTRRRGNFAVLTQWGRAFRLASRGLASACNTGPGWRASLPAKGCTGCARPGQA